LIDIRAERKGGMQDGMGLEVMEQLMK
jgi:hypothetical protein